MKVCSGIYKGIFGKRYTVYIIAVLVCVVFRAAIYDINIAIVDVHVFCVIVITKAVYNDIITAGYACSGSNPVVAAINRTVKNMGFVIVGYILNPIVKTIYYAVRNKVVVSVVRPNAN